MGHKIVEGMVDSTTESVKFQRSRWLIRLMVGILIGIVCLWWASHDLNLSILLSTFTLVSPVWVGVALGGVVALALAKAARWGALYGEVENKPFFLQSFAVLMIAQAINILVPVRVGELVRIGLMKQAGYSGSVTTMTIIIEKTLDLTTTGLVAFSLVVLAAAPEGMREPASEFVVMGVVLVTGLILVWCLRNGIENMLRRILAWALLPQTWQVRLWNMFHTMLNSLHVLAGWRSLGRILFWTVLIWLLSLLVIIFLFASFSLHVPLTAAVLIMLAISVGNILPSPPALIGLMHGIAVLVLGQYGVDRTTALGFGIVLNIVTVAPVILLGAVALWQQALWGWLAAKFTGAY